MAHVSKKDTKRETRNDFELNENENTKYLWYATNAILRTFIAQTMPLLEKIKGLKSMVSASTVIN